LARKAAPSTSSASPRVQLFATCVGDLVFPDAVEDAERLLRDAGYEVEFPSRQVCCGQPAFNSGHHAAARRPRLRARL
jgi:L-lactate dehydrogenase complex protein LldE